LYLSGGQKRVRGGELVARVAFLGAFNGVRVGELLGVERLVRSRALGHVERVHLTPPATKKIKLRQKRGKKGDGGKEEVKVEKEDENTFKEERERKDGPELAR
jgi:hypothetical protein